MTRQYSNLVPRISPFPEARKKRDPGNEVDNIPADELHKYRWSCDIDTEDLQLRCIRCAYEIFPNIRSSERSGI